MKIPGHLHRRDENGNRSQLRFATMLAKRFRNGKVVGRTNFEGVKSWLTYFEVQVSGLTDF